MDYEEKLRYSALFCTKFKISANLSHLVKDAKGRIIGGWNRDLEVAQKVVISGIPPAQKIGAGGGNYCEEVQDGSITMGEPKTEISTARISSERYRAIWCGILRKLDLAMRKQMPEAS